ncbi:retrotransposon protein, putative, ty1-copia subclass [Tanacetum coccineum]
MERKIDEWSKYSEQIDRTEPPPPPQAQTEHVNSVSTGSEKSDDPLKIQKDPPPPIIVNNKIEKDRPFKISKRDIIWSKQKDIHFHDGLLNSTDIESFDKCVSCLSGKMTRKPYSHEVERAKDLHGLINTDVCAPFRTVSRQGASYFFQKEVENQLGKTIKSVCSGHGGEYTSQEFLDHLKEHGIITHHTPPYTPQHNGVSERSNRTLLDMVRSMMSQTTLPKFTRTQHAPYRMCIYIDADEHELGDLNKLANYKAALLDPKYDKWLATMNVEMQSRKDNQVWDLVDLPPNSKTISRKWLFKKKNDMDGNIHTYKARLIAKGFTQTYECFARKDLGEASYVLGIKIYRDRSRRLIGLCQSAYIEKNLKRFHMENSKRGSIPMQDKPKLCKSQDASTPAEKSTKQSILATSCEEAEYIVALDTSKEDVWIRKFIYGFSVLPTNEVPTKMYCDNTEAITIANEPVITKDDNGVDPFTKALPFNKNSEHTKNIGRSLEKELSRGLSESKKIKLGALNLYVGKGHRTSIEAIGNFHLYLPSGLVVILNNCHYAPSITRGIILLSLLKDNGFVNCFIDNGISVSKDGLHYFHAIPRDGIYEIDLHCANFNDSSIYVVSNKRAKLNLDSTLLWHCRLRHISKKQIERLKHDVSHASLEVENQLGKTIKLQHFDRASEYMSQEFLDHLKEHGIITHCTPPYTPQHNGYLKETIGNSFYYPPENKVLVARNAEFFENSLITQEASGSLKDLEIIHDEDMHPFENTSLHHDEDDQEINEPQSDIIHHELGDLNKHANYKAALLDPESDKRLAAMNCLFKKKTDMDGNIHTYKDRLVAKGFTQSYRVDYEETFSLVADIRAIRILIAIAAFYDYEIWQMDVKTAFLNGHLFEEVYMVKLEGASTPAEVKRMQRVLYASTVGSIMYDVRCTRSDVAFAQDMTSLFQQNPGDLH